MRRTHASEALRALRIGSALLLCLAIAVVLFALRQAAAAGGILIGFALYFGNALLLVEIGRALVREERHARAAVAVAAAGRLVLLGVLLAGVFLVLGKPAGLGACGGLLASQVNLHLPMRRPGVAI